LFRDAVVTVSIAEWDLTCNLFDGETALGPVPRLFAANPDDAHATLISDEARAFRDLQRIMGKFLVPENIPPHKAWDFLNNIRYTHSLILNECSQQFLLFLSIVNGLSYYPPKSPVNHFP
jgi:hypothetical protein